MWRVIAVFLLLLVLSAVSAMKREGFYWLIALFSTFLAVGIFIYLTYVFRKGREYERNAKDIKSAMGAPVFAYQVGSNESGSDEPRAVPVSEVPKITTQEQPAIAPQQNEIHVPSLEMPKIDEPKPSGQITPEITSPPAAEPPKDTSAKGKDDSSQIANASSSDDSELTPIDIEALKAKIRKGQ